ncbi:DNA-binding SARP family transcriptional activator [Nonomuraea fuscirosea]|uniref:DNA-binding SARP family transcriptional activator n=1 Tax=Nonomuraea fuscirosea TaxID=1291556 RepID=A0A2T0MQ29_9ACTN|nr:DNA-binding SARP family transcriptional activator [Nonomuraea fuscirosea]
MRGARGGARADRARAGRVRFQLLGPLRVQPTGTPVRISARKQRTVIAMLLAHAGRAVPIRSLVTEVWDGRPPRSAVPNLHTYVMQLRHLLSAADSPAADRLVTSDGGYLLLVEPPELDLFRFEEQLARARKAWSGENLGAAEAAYARALGMWHGAPAEDVPLGPALRTVVADLTDRYLSTVEEHIDVQLALGAHREAAERLRTLTARYPLREHLHAQLMLALHRCGDRPGALAAFAAARHALAEELGLDPGAELRRLHRMILGHDVDPGGSVVTLRGARRLLPPVPPAFVDRPRLVTLATTALTAPAGQGGGVRVVALHGGGGSGKSALALRVAQRVAGRYADGVLYADLGGSTAGVPPARPVEVLGELLRTLGVPGDEVPVTEAEAAALYRSVLAGRRVLVVLDNATGAAQVTPLIPAGDGCAALVTCRGLPATLDAVPIAVGPLEEAEAVRLLASLAGEPRVAAEPEAAAEVVRSCGRLPLAVRAAGTRLAGRPDLPLETFAVRLRDRGSRLDLLPGVRSCVRAGYDQLSDRSDAARAFRSLGALDQPEVDVAVTAALLGVPRAAAERALDVLVELRLLEPAPGGRLRMHDLVRLAAAELNHREETASRGTDSG